MTTTMKNTKMSNIQLMDKQHHIHPFTDTALLGAEGSRVFVRGDNIYVWDSEGNKYFDAMSGLWCVNIGYGRDELADVAAKQMRALPFYNSFFNCSVEPAIELAAKLAQISPPQFNHCFFTGSGSEANDTMIRMVRRYWDLCGKHDKKVIISRLNAYHGSTIGGASLGGMAFMHEQGDLPIKNIAHIGQPYSFELQGNLSEEEFAIQSAQLLEEKIMEIGANRIAAFVGEPVQGAGGVVIPPQGYWEEIQRICNKHDILLVADEVICGFGRLGHWFGSDYYNINADIMPIAKGLSSGYLPIGGLLVGDRVADTLIAKGKEFAHGFTYSGHPTCCAVALANINIIEKESLVERTANELAPALNKKWLTLAEHSLVGEARSVGALAALELVVDKETRRRYDDKHSAGVICRDICIEEGIIMRAVRDTMIICPPLITTDEQLDELIAKVCIVLDRTAEKIL